MATRTNHSNKRSRVREIASRRQNPARATARVTLPEDAKSDVLRKLRSGVPADWLAEEYGCSDEQVRRIADRARARQLIEQPIDYIHSKEFDRVNAESRILVPAPEAPEKKPRLRAPAGLPPYLASLYEIPLLTQEQEQHYFRKMNFLKYQAAQLQAKLNPARPNRRLMERIEQLMAESDEVRNLLIRRNLRLVVSIAKKYTRPGGNFFEAVSDGNISLMRAIDKFDYSRGFKLSTYATWAIRKNFARSIPAEYTHQSRFRTGGDEWFGQSRDERANPFEQERTNDGQREVITHILEQLPDRDREIIAVRYGLERGTEPQTLEAVGQRFGVSKERIRQLEARALRRMKEYAEERKLDIPGV